MLIQSKVANNSPFFFNEASLSDIEKGLWSLNPKKACTFKNIPPKILKKEENVVRTSWKNTLRNKEFPDELKLADVTPIYKKYDHDKSKNCRSVSVLPLVSKVFERFVHKQMSQDVNRFLAPFLCGY